MSGILLSKSFGRQRHEIGRFRDENQRLTGLQIRQTMIGRSFFAVVGTFFSITPALVYLVCGWVLSNGERASTTATSSRSPRCSRGCSSRSARCSRSRPRCRARSRCSIASSSTSTCEHDIKDAPDAVHLDPAEVRGAVRARATCGSATTSPRSATHAGVSPTTSRSRTRAPREWTLDDISMRIEPGQLAALVGPERGRQDHDHLPGPPALRRAAGARSRSTASTCAASRWSRSATTSAWSPRRPICSTRRSGATCCTGVPTPRRRSSRPPRGRPTSTIASSSCPRATTRWWASAATSCPGARSSGSRSPGWC